MVPSTACCQQELRLPTQRNVSTHDDRVDPLTADRGQNEGDRGDQLQGDRSEARSTAVDERENVVETDCGQCKAEEQ